LSGVLLKKSSLAMPEESLNQGVPDATPPATDPVQPPRRRESVADTVASRFAAHCAGFDVSENADHATFAAPRCGHSFDGLYRFLGLDSLPLPQLPRRFFMSRRRFGSTPFPVE